MKSITFNCEVITPMFLAGADGSTPELRPASIKGTLRFWWRAMNGDLGLEELKKREGEIFGDNSSRSCFTIRITDRQINVGESIPVPHKRYKISSINKGSTFSVIFSIIESESFNIGKLKSLFEITTILGGYGKRSRRAMGSIKIMKVESEGRTLPYENHIDSTYVFNLLQKHSTHFQKREQSIFLAYQGTMQPYPWIRQIEFGNDSGKNIPNLTSKTTHDLHGKYGQSYEPNLGHASKGRFASPVIVSVYENENTPIITTLNTIPDRGQGNLDKFIQENFKKCIL